MSTDTEQRLGELLQQAAIDPPRQITVELVRRRATRQRQSLAASGLATVAVIAAAVSVPLAVSGHGGSGPKVSTALALPALVLGVDRRGRVIVDDLDSHKRSVVGGGLPTAIVATNPNGGWITNYHPNAVGAVDLKVVSRSAHTEPLGNALHHFYNDITAVAVSPDGSMIAIAEQTPDNTTQSPFILIRAMPGHTGPRHTWPAGTHANPVRSLSWSSDGHNVTFLLRNDTGTSGVAGPVTLNVTSAGLIPRPTDWTKARAGCQVDAASWLGDSGQFAVLERCGPHNRGTVVMIDPSNGSPTSPGAVLPGDPGCFGTSMHPSQSGQQILVGWCGRVYLVKGQRIRQLPGGLTDAAFPGRAPTS